METLESSDGKEREKKNDITNPRWVIRVSIVSVSTILILIFGLWFLAKNNTQSVDGIRLPDALSHTFVSNIENITLEIPDNWEVISLENLKFYPQVLEKISFAFKKKDSGCVIAYGKMKADLKTFQQITFGDRVFSSDWQFDSSWYVSKDKAPKLSKDFIFSTVDRQYSEEEFRLTMMFRRSNLGLILFDENKISVPDQCNEDMNNLLLSLDYHYNPIKLDKSSKGTLWVVKEFGDANIFTKTGDTSRVFILFTPDGSSENFSVVNLSENVAWQRFLILNNKLYFVLRETDSKRTVIKLLDIFSQESSDLLLTNDYIVSTYLHNGEIYYLSRDEREGFCPGTYSECKTDLYKVNLNNGQSKLLAENITGASIMGYSKNEDAIYLQDSWGDAGCFTERFTKYTIYNNKTEFIGGYSSCSGDEGYDETMAIIESIYKRTNYNQEKTELIGIRDGMIVPQATLPSQLENRDVTGTFLFDN